MRVLASLSLAVTFFDLVGQQARHLAFWQGLHLPQGAVHDVAARLRLVQGVQNRLGLLIDSGQNIAKLAKLSFTCTQTLPDFAGAFF